MSALKLVITLITRNFPLFCIEFSIFLTTVRHIISVKDFPLFCSNYVRKFLILPAECSPQNHLFCSKFYLQNLSKPSLTVEGDSLSPDSDDLVVFIKNCIF